MWLIIFNTKKCAKILVHQKKAVPLQCSITKTGGNRVNSADYIMDYKAIYNTTLKGMEYDFSAKSDAKAEEFCKLKFNTKDIYLLNRNTGEAIHIGDRRKTNAIARRFWRKEGLV